MTTSIFIKSWQQDLKWLRYCLRFLEKNWTEKRSDIVVMLDEDCVGEIYTDDYKLDLRLTYEDPWPDGYSHAMFCKARADVFCSGDTILLLDSDSMLLEPADASGFFEAKPKLPIIPYITYKEHYSLYPHSPWQKVTYKVMKIHSENHYMPTMPICYWSNTFRQLRRYITEQHKEAENFREAVYSDVPFDPANFAEHPISFVDYDCLGLFAATFEPQQYVFRHADEMSANPFKQFHSWSEWNENTPKILDRLLEQVAV